MPTSSAKAGEYELLVNYFAVYNKDGTRIDYEKGDIVTLDAAEAERLTTCTPPAVAVPGSLAQAEADRLQAAADAAKAKADQAREKAAGAATAAKAAAKP